MECSPPVTALSLPVGPSEAWTRSSDRVRDPRRVKLNVTRPAPCATAPSSRQFVHLPPSSSAGCRQISRDAYRPSGRICPIASVGCVDHVDMRPIWGSFAEPTYPGSLRTFLRLLRMLLLSEILSAWRVTSFAGGDTVFSCAQTSHASASPVSSLEPSTGRVVQFPLKSRTRDKPTHPIFWFSRLAYGPRHPSLTAKNRDHGPASHQEELALHNAVRLVAASDSGAYNAMRQAPTGPEQYSRPTSLHNTCPSNEPDPHPRSSELGRKSACPGSRAARMPIQLLRAAASRTGIGVAGATPHSHSTARSPLQEAGSGSWLGPACPRRRLWPSPRGHHILPQSGQRPSSQSGGRAWERETRVASSDHPLQRGSTVDAPAHRLPRPYHLAASRREPARPTMQMAEGRLACTARRKGSSESRVPDTAARAY